MFLKALEQVHQKSAVSCIDLCSRLISSLENKSNTVFVVQYVLRFLGSELSSDRVQRLRLLRLGCKVGRVFD